jgi:hypothetical protein
MRIKLEKLKKALTFVNKNSSILKKKTFSDSDVSAYSIYEKLS